MASIMTYLEINIILQSKFYNNSTATALEMSFVLQLFYCIVLDFVLIKIYNSYLPFILSAYVVHLFFFMYINKYYYIYILAYYLHNKYQRYYIN